MRDLISSAVRSALSNQRSYNLVQSSIGFHISVTLSDFSIRAINILNIFTFDDVPTKKSNNIFNISSLEDEADRFNNQVMGFQLDLAAENMNFLTDGFHLCVNPWLPSEEGEMREIGGIETLFVI